MKTKLIKHIILPAIAIIGVSIASSCSENRFKIEGEISGADSEQIVLEKSDFNGRWIVVDSTRTGKEGRFKMSQPSPGVSEIYRLKLNDRYIYFPADSTETITVSSSLERFGEDFSITGSEDAIKLAAFDKDFIALPANISPDSLIKFKKRVFSEYMMDARGSIVSYYILTKMKGDKFLFDPKNSDDAKYFAAVATGYKSSRPDDPRTALLEKTSIDALKRRNSEKGNLKEILAEEIKVIDINLPDEKGENKKLSDLTGNGKPTVVIFSNMTLPESPALNIELSRLYSNKNINYYHISLIEDQYQWRDAAVNLPWITVYDPEGAYSDNLRNYNVTDLPVFFIYNANGELVNRANTIDELKKML